MARTTRTLAACMLSVCTAAGVAEAQTPPPAGLQIVQPAEGDCIVRVDNTDTTTTGLQIEIDLNKQSIGRQTVSGRRRIELWIRGPLDEGDLLRARRVAPGQVGEWSGPVKVGPADGDPDCTASTQTDDGSGDPRDAVNATLYVGTAVDNFAPAIVAGYEEKVSEHARYTAGVDFDFRVWPRRSVNKDGVQVWIFGETLHGVRTADVDCGANPKPPVCGDATTPTGQNFRFVLKHASSFEAFVEPRVELTTIEPDSPFPIRLYVGGRFGIMMLTEGKNYAAEAHHLGVGVLAPAGKFQDSYLEVGWGKTELFAPPREGTLLRDDKQWNRLKIDAILSVPVLQAFLDRVRFWRTQPRLFIQLYADFDPGGKAADSVQTFFGMDLPVGGLLK